MADKELKKMIATLSENDRESLKVILNEGTSKTELSDSQLNRIVDDAEKYRAAQRQVADAVGVLWNAQLDMAIQTRDPSKIGRAITRPGGEVAFYDNCSCGGGGGNW